MTSSGLFIWGYYYSWNLKLNLSQLALALSSQMQLPVLCPHDERTNEQDGKMKRRKRNRDEKSIWPKWTWVLFIVWHFNTWRFPFFRAIVYEWKGIIWVLLTRSIAKQSAMANTTMEKLLPNCVLKWMSVMWIRCSAGPSIVPFLLAVSTIIESNEKANERVGAQSRAFLMSSMGEIWQTICSCSPNVCMWMAWALAKRVCVYGRERER